MILLTPSRYLAFGELAATVGEDGRVRYVASTDAPKQLAPDQAPPPQETEP